MASADDPFADLYNTTAVGGMMNPNPYLQYQGQIPMAGYRGTPTDAQGNPIASYGAAQTAHDAWQPPGTTLNTSGVANPFAGVQIPQGQNDAAYQPRGGLTPMQWQALSPQQRLDASGPLGQVAAGVAATQPDSFVASHNSPSGGSPGAGAMFQGLGATAFHQMANQPSAPAAAPAPTNPIDMRQAYLDALANPGKVTTPGAVMQPGTTPTGGPQPSVLNAFLAAHPSGGTQIPGGYSNTGFFNTLQNLQAQKGATS
jgi:hypothetical protein